MRLRRLVADSLKRLVQLLHFVRSQCLSPENWCLCVENGVLPGFWGHFGVFLAILGRKTGTFSYFFPVTSLLREGVGVLGATTHLLNVSGHRRRLVRRTVERLVGLFMLIDDTPLQIWARYVTDYIRGAFVQNVLIWLREGEGDINFNIATAVIDKCSILGR